jgi:minor extracellular protease Epr
VEFYRSSIVNGLITTGQTGFHLSTGWFPSTGQALLVALSLAFSPAAFAQLPGLGDGNILRGIDDAIDRSVDRTVDRAVTDHITGRIDRSIEKLMQAKDLPKALLDPLLDQPLLPARKEVAVEGGWRALDHEWIALLTPEQLPTLQAANVQIISRRTLAATGLVLVRVVVSDADNAPGRAEALLRSLGATAADRNHIYDERNGPAPDFDPSPAPSPAPQGGGGGKITIGLIDTSLARKHASLSRATISERDFVESASPRPTAHGTAIASLLVGRERDHRGLLPGARLVAASVFYQGESGATGATTSALVAALDWMSAENVKVVNMSLAGPSNQVLGAMIEALSKRGMIVVAAVGNDGPSAQPLYPAAFEPVVAVTAVDRRSNVYRWANQGPQVDFAAVGVATPVALPKGGYGEETGTSFAAPIVAAAIAQEIARSGSSASAAVQSLISRAEDLGAKGRDNTFGHGLVKPAT